MNEANTADTVWAVRFTRRARADVDTAWDYFAVSAGEPLADLWQEGLENSVASLAQMPGRCPVAQEAAYFPPPLVRQLVYRRTRGGPAYRVLFRMINNGEDAPFVRVIAVRHGAQEPMTREDAEVLKNNEYKKAKMETGFGNDPIGLRARELYEAGIKQKVEPEQFGKYLVIDINTGEYDLDADNYAVSLRTYEKNPHGERVCVRIGYRATGDFRAAQKTP